MGYGDVDRQAGHEGAVEFVFETIEDVGVREEIASSQSDIGHQRGAGNSNTLLRNTIANVKHLHLAATAVDVVQVDVFGDRRPFGKRGETLVGYREDGVEGHATALGQQHFCKEQAVGGFGEIHLSLVEFHTDTGEVSLCGDICLDHLVNVIVKRLQEGGIFLCHLFFMLN